MSDGTAPVDPHSNAAKPDGSVPEARPVDTTVQEDAAEERATNGGYT